MWCLYVEQAVSVDSGLGMVSVCEGCMREAFLRGEWGAYGWVGSGV